jgi:CBS domain-containing protein
MSLIRFKRPVATASEQDTVEEAARTMRDRGVGCLIVRDARRATGIVTDRDLVVRVLAHGIDPTTAPIGKFVTFDPITVSLHDGVETAIERMRRHGVRRLPIVDEEGAIAGIVTADDLLMLLGAEIGGIAQAIEERADSGESR